jgi:hypothetical protein
MRTIIFLIFFSVFFVTNIVSAETLADVNNNNVIERNAKLAPNLNYKDIQQLNKFNGDVTEGVMSNYFKSSSWTQIEGEVGVNGIDGLFIKRDKNGNIKDLLFVESKYNNSQLGHINKNDPTKKARQMSKDALDKQLDNLIKKVKNDIKSKTGKEKAKLENLLKDYSTIKSKIEIDDYRARIFKLKPLGDNKFRITIDALDQNGFKNVVKQELDGKNKYKVHNLEIDLGAKYEAGSYKDKIQKFIKKNIEEVKTSKNIKEIYKNGNKFTELIKSIPSTIIKKGAKTIAFVDAKVLSKVSKLKYFKNVKGADVVMLVIESGAITYSLLKGGVTYAKVSSLLVSGAKTGATEVFSNAVLMFTPPPATIAVIATIAGAIIIDYSIDKYVELDKRNYVSIEDMLWDVPDEIKNKITVLNLEDVKKETIFDFSNIEKETIYDSENEKETILENNNNEKETIFN